MDLYAVLGLSPGASVADIKRAYRRLARRFHPGINPGDRAAASMYSRITEAYEILTDPERRRQYEQEGRQTVVSSATFEFTGFDFSASAQGAQAATFTELFADVLHPVTSPDTGRPEAGADLHAELTVAFDESVRGVERQIVVTRLEVCAACGGRGQIATPEARCPGCQGTGTLRWARGHMVFAKPCSSCGGTGRQRVQRCAVCVGHGRSMRSEAIAVAVPPGVIDGLRLRVPGKGHVGRYGGRTGDLYVTVHVQAHPRFRRDGDDLHLVVPIGVHEAVLGTRMDVETPDGPARLRVPPGTQGGQHFRLRGRGMPTASGGRGDLIIEVRIVLPPIVDERSKELIREFGRLYGTIR
ncbi:MAG TPA: J domain-containing protein [Vicinamibacterales bacterium]|nr:J domain-containing protein [Vicinamibacterales bacterium]